MLENFFRVFKFGWQNFWRNLWLSFGSIFVIFIALLLVGGVVFLWGMTENLTEILESKVDITVYFKDNVQEKDILEVKKHLTTIPEVKNIDYISKEKALETFKENYKDNSLVIESLKEVGGNPLPASLNINAASAVSYEKITSYLTKSEFNNLIDNINWKDTKDVINKLFTITSNIKKIGGIVSIVLIAIAALVIFNTVRLSIYARNKEIEIMKLVGATNWFTRGPFLIEGILLGLLGGLLCFCVFYWINYALFDNPPLLLSDLGFFSFFQENLLLILAIEIGGGVGIGFLSSFFAVQRYLNV